VRRRALGDPFRADLPRPPLDRVDGEGRAGQVTQVLGGASERRRVGAGGDDLGQQRRADRALVKAQVTCLGKKSLAAAPARPRRRWPADHAGAGGDGTRLGLGGGGRAAAGGASGGPRRGRGRLAGQPGDGFGHVQQRRASRLELDM
jgi:hypothetical protein